MQSRDVISGPLGVASSLNGTGGHWVWAKAVGASVLVLSGGTIRAQPPIFVDNELEWAAWRVAQPGQEYCGEGVGLMVPVVGDQLGWWQAAGTVDNHVWLPPSTRQMGHQFIPSAWPVKAREYNSRLVVDLVYGRPLPVFHIIEQP